MSCYLEEAINSKTAISGIWVYESSILCQIAFEKYLISNAYLPWKWVIISFCPWQVKSTLNLISKNDILFSFILSFSHHLVPTRCQIPYHYRLWGFNSKQNRFKKCPSHVAYRELVKWHPWESKFYITIGSMSPKC